MQVPRNTSHAHGASAHRSWCNRAARRLLLTVIKDLQDHPGPEGYWTKRLGGTRVAVWKPDVVSEKRTSLSRPSAHKKGIDKVASKKSHSTINPPTTAARKKTIKSNIENLEAFARAGTPLPAYNSKQETAPTYSERQDKETARGVGTFTAKSTKNNLSGKALYQQAASDWGENEDYSHALATSPSSGISVKEPPGTDRDFCDSQTKSQGSEQTMLADFQILRPDEESHIRNADDGTFKSDSEDNLFVTPRSSRQTSIEPHQTAYDKRADGHHTTRTMAKCTGHSGPGGAARHENLKVKLKETEAKLKETEADCKLRQRRHSQISRRTHELEKELEEEKRNAMLIHEHNTHKIADMQAKIEELEERLR